VTWLNILTVPIVVKIIILIFLALSETGRRNYPQSLLDRLSDGIDFQWFSHPPHGRSGGMLVGVRSDNGGFGQFGW
jgi:hypothetical protein